MDNLVIHDGVVVVDGQLQRKEPIAQRPNVLSALIGEAHEVADDMVGLAYERDLLNAVLVHKCEQLCQLFTAMDREYAATKAKLIAMQEPVWN
jgi:hypothetical protein